MLSLNISLVDSQLHALRAVICVEKWFWIFVLGTGEYPQNPKKVVIFFRAGGFAANGEISAAISSGTLIAASLSITCSSYQRWTWKFPIFRRTISQSKLILFAQFPISFIHFHPTSNLKPDLFGNARLANFDKVGCRPETPFARFQISLISLAAALLHSNLTPISIAAIYSKFICFANQRNFCNSWLNLQYNELRLQSVNK